MIRRLAASLLLLFPGWAALAQQAAPATKLTYVGSQVCGMCHEDIGKAFASSPHEAVDKGDKHGFAGNACEACHGPLGKHAEDPQAMVPVRPDTAVLCVKCHEANSAKPKSFPQVISKEHAGDTACGTCHKPHQPKIGDDAPASNGGGPKK